MSGGVGCNKWLLVNVWSCVHLPCGAKGGVPGETGLPAVFSVAVEPAVVVGLITRPQCVRLVHGGF